MIAEATHNIGKISVILATYNERENIVALIDAISDELKENELEFVVVDDDSPDLTWQCVAERAENNRHIRLLRRRNERGLTSALNAGIRMATGDVVVWLDCDFQHPPSKIPQLLAAMQDGHYDAVIGSRFMNDARADQRLAADTGQPGIVRFHGHLSVAISQMTKA